MKKLLLTAVLSATGLFTSAAHAQGLTPIYDSYYNGSFNNSGSFHSGPMNSSTPLTCGPNGCNTNSNNQTICGPYGCFPNGNAGINTGIVPPNIPNSSLPYTTNRPDFRAYDQATGYGPGGPHNFGSGMHRGQHFDRNQRADRNLPAERHRTDGSQFPGWQNDSSFPARPGFGQQNLRPFDNTRDRTPFPMTPSSPPLNQTIPINYGPLNHSGMSSW